MADTVETLRAELDKLRKEFDEFKTYAKPVIDDHQPGDFKSGSTSGLLPPPTFK